MPAPTVPNIGILLPEAAGVADDGLGEHRRPGRGGDVRVGDAVAVAAAEAGARAGAARRCRRRPHSSEEPHPARIADAAAAANSQDTRFARSHDHKSDRKVAESSFSASWHGSPPLDVPRNCTHQLNTPGAGGSGGRARRAGGVTPRQERLVPFDVRFGDGRAALGGQCPLAVQAAGLEPGEGHVDRRRQPRVSTYWQTAPL